MEMKTGPPPGTQARQAVCRHWEYSGDEDIQVPCPHGAYSPVGESNINNYRSGEHLEGKSRHPLLSSKILFSPCSLIPGQ